MRLRVDSFEDLEVYQSAFKLASEVFRISKSFPPEERYSLTDQIRRASRSIGANLAEAWAKRKYPAHFASKLTDADGELQETKHWIRCARADGYLSEDAAQSLESLVLSTGRQLGAMMKTATSFCEGSRPPDRPTV